MVERSLFFLPCVVHMHSFWTSWTVSFFVGWICKYIPFVAFLNRQSLTFLFCSLCVRVEVCFYFYTVVVEMGFGSNTKRTSEIKLETRGKWQGLCYPRSSQCDAVVAFYGFNGCRLLFFKYRQRPAFICWWNARTCMGRCLFYLCLFCLYGWTDSPLCLTLIMASVESADFVSWLCVFFLCVFSCLHPF